MHYWDAVFAFLVAMGVAFVLTPLAARLARRVDAVSTPNERGLAEHATPLLGGLAILAGVLLAAVLWMPAVIRLHPIAHAGRAGEARRCTRGRSSPAPA